MIFILEGPDGAGKSTLAEKLRLLLQKSSPYAGDMIHTVKHGPYTGVSAEHLCKIYFRAMSPALTHDDHLLMDRSWLSEPIYGEVYRKGYNRIDLHRKRMLERAALARGAVVILCLPDLAACEKSFTSRIDQEYLSNTAQLKRVYAEYMSLSVQTCLPVINYDYEHDDVEHLIDHAMSVSIENGASGGGAFKEGNILMLCDKGPRANVRDSAVVIPFINFLDNDGPSRMITQALQNEGIEESDVYWSNTQNGRGQPTDPEFIERLKPSKIFALGNNAFTWALNNNVKVIKLPPPLHHMQNYPNEPYRIMESQYGNFNN